MSGAQRRVDYLLWLNRLFGWDAILPIAVSYASVAVAHLFKHQPPADVLALMGLPVAAFLVRAAVGVRQIRQNSLGPIGRGVQITALVVGLFALAIVDLFIALRAFVPAENKQFPAEVVALCLVAGAVYTTCVAVAMYPGRTVSHDAER